MRPYFLVSSLCAAMVRSARCFSHLRNFFRCFGVPCATRLAAASASAALRCCVFRTRRRFTTSPMPSSSITANIDELRHIRMARRCPQSYAKHSATVHTLSHESQTRPLFSEHRPHQPVVTESIAVLIKRYWPPASTDQAGPEKRLAYALAHVSRLSGSLHSKPPAEERWRGGGFGAMRPPVPPDQRVYALRGGPPSPAPSRIRVQARRSCDVRRWRRSACANAARG